MQIPAQVFHVSAFKYDLRNPLGKSDNEEGYLIDYRQYFRPMIGDFVYLHCPEKKKSWVVQIKVLAYVPANITSIEVYVEILEEADTER